MTRQGKRDYTPVTVPFGAIPAGEPPSVVEWANRSVWTDCMLETLHCGVRGGKCLLRRTWAAQPWCRPYSARPILSEVRPPSGKPYAGEPPVRFGGRGDRTQSVLPTPINCQGRKPLDEQHGTIKAAERRHLDALHAQFLRILAGPLVSPRPGCAVNDFRTAKCPVANVARRWETHR